MVNRACVNNLWIKIYFWVFIIQVIYLLCQILLDIVWFFSLVLCLKLKYLLVNKRRERRGGICYGLDKATTKVPMHRVFRLEVLRRLWSNKRWGLVAVCKIPGAMLLKGILRSCLSLLSASQFMIPPLTSTYASSTASCHPHQWLNQWATLGNMWMSKLGGK